MSVHLYVHTSVRPCTKSFFDLNEIWYIGRGRWVMHDGMPYGRIQGQGQGHEPLKVWIPSISKPISSAIYTGSWQMTTNSWTRAQYLNLIGRISDICPSVCVTWLWTLKKMCPVKIYFDSRQNCYVGKDWWVMLDGMSDSDQGSKISTHGKSKIQSPTGLIFNILI